MRYHFDETRHYVLAVKGFNTATMDYDYARLERVAVVKHSNYKFIVWDERSKTSVRVIVGIRDWKTNEELPSFVVSRDLVKRMFEHYGMWIKKKIS